MKPLNVDEFLRGCTGQADGGRVALSAVYPHFLEWAAGRVSLPPEEARRTYTPERMAGMLAGAGHQLHKSPYKKGALPVYHLEGIKLD